MYVTLARHFDISRHHKGHVGDVSHMKGNEICQIYSKCVAQCVLIQVPTGSKCREYSMVSTQFYAGNPALYCTVHILLHSVVALQTSQLLWYEDAFRVSRDQ